MFLNKTLSSTTGFDIIKVDLFSSVNLKSHIPREPGRLSLLSFFGHNYLDVPCCFASSRSLYRNNKSNLVKKLSNYLTSNGSRHGTLKLINTLMTSYRASDVFAWQLKANLASLINYTTFDKHRAISQPRKASITPGLEDLFNRALSSLSPIFMLYIYKVDKAIYKNSRGKSGKFTFIWKYVAPFRRNHMLFYWINKELKTSKLNNYNDRLKQVILAYIFTPNSTFIHKARRFSYNYVYYNHKTTLATTFISSTK